jgi:hypothetical protein
MKVALASGFMVFALLCLTVAWSTLAEDGGKRSSSSKVQAPTISMPALGALPSTEGLTATKAEKLVREPTVSPESASYSVVKIQHAKAFARSGGGLQPVGGAISAVQLTGKPPSTPKFSTVIRVKSPEKSNLPIQVEILDGRGEVALSVAGEVSFRGVKGHEADYQVDWDPVPLRMGGDFQVRVRVAGQPMGNWPFQVLEEKQ